MITFKLNGLEVQVEDGSTILEACKFYGIEIPTLCYNEGLSSYGGCRLCLVQIGEGENAKLVSSCTYPVEQGLKVRTNTKRVINARKMMIELLLSVCPSSKTIQDLASKFNVRKVRFPVRHEDCILCGLCIRMCKEQMQSGAIGFVERGYKKKIMTPFNIKSDVCRLCGGCMYICPACQLRCQGPDAQTDVCNACLSLEPTCINVYDDYQCWMGTTGDCGTCEGRPDQIKKKKRGSDSR
ncbi:(2Fe-2S)-binding protein [candidate division WOR-3 bacterium]|nr:(2Fe-2S)-binding protein [candidate division WOR-3 bacterium]